MRKFSATLKNSTFFLCALISITVAVGTWIVSHRFCSRLSCLAFDQKDTFILKDVYEERRNTVFRGLYTVQNSPLLFRVDVRSGIESGIAYDYIRGKIAGMKALYDNIQSPYPGLLSNEIVCDARFKPTYTTFVTPGGIEVYQISGFLNERYSFGSCVEDQIRYKDMRMLFSCKTKKQLYDLEFITPITSSAQDAFDSFVKSVRCM
jgi:hypothetical protein